MRVTCDCPVCQGIYFWNHHIRVLLKSLPGMDKGDGEDTCLRCGEFMDACMGGVCTSCWEAAAHEDAEQIVSKWLNHMEAPDEP